MLSRRRVGVLGAAATGMALGAEVARAAEVGRLVPVRGTRIYVEDTGPRDAPALLYLHGGPGTGGYDFSFYQRERLSPRLRLVVIDQRGVLRSNPILETDAFGFADLVADCEALRNTLGISSWTVVGHSFGGYLATAYALSHPDAVSRLVFENPAWDFASSGRYLLRLEAAKLRSVGRDGEARDAEAAAELPATTPEADVWEAFGRTTNRLGQLKDDLYVHGPDKQFFSQLVVRSGLSQTAWQEGMTQQRRLYREGLVFNPLTPRLDDLAMPAVLLKGRYDPVTSPDQVGAFLANPRHEMVVLDQSAHFAHVEEPDRFARLVTSLATTGVLSGEDRAEGWSGVPSA